MAAGYFYDSLSWNLSLCEGNKVVTRSNREGSGIVYLTDEIAINESFSLRVETVDPFAGGQKEELHMSLKLGLTTCDSSVVTNFPYHLIEPCQPSHDCMGHTMVINIKNANKINDEVRMERKAAGLLQVSVNRVPVFSLTDPHDSIFPFSKSAAYPFLVLCGSVSKIRLVESSEVCVMDDNNSSSNNNKTRMRHDSCCVICMDKGISHMAVPCNHAAFCDYDAQEQMKISKVCPVCRRHVTSFVRIFIP